MKPKRLISLLVAVCMMITMLPLSAVTAFAADTSTEQEATVDGYRYEYKVDANGNATITKFLGPVDSEGNVDSANHGPYDIEIPEKLDKYTVTGLGDHSFAYRYRNPSYYWGFLENPLCSNIRSVKIPQGVTSIGESAFRECSALEKVNIPNAITSIGNSVFYGCSVLDNVNIPVGVTSIGKYAFTSCALTNVTIPQSVTSIGDDAFAHCEKLDSLTINDAATSIGDWAFQECPLTTLELGENITTIGEYAFYKCNMKSVTIPKSVTSIDDSAFYYCPKLANVTIPEKVKTIKPDTFTSCEQLAYIMLPAGLTSFQDKLLFCPDGCVIYYNNDEATADERFGSHTELAGHKLLCLCKVTFDANGGELNDYDGNLTDHAVVPVYRTEKITDTKANDLKETDLDAINHPTRTGYNFIGWYTTADGKPEDGKFDVDKTEITKDITLYARWEFDPDAPSCRPLTVTGGTVTVKYDGSDVTSTLNSRTDEATGKKTYYVPDGAEVTVTLDEALIPAGNVFDSWSTGNLSLPTGDYKAESITFTMNSGVDIAAQYRDAATDHTPDTAVCHPLTVKDGVITSVTVPGKDGADPKDITEIVKKNANEDGSFNVPEGATVSVAFDKDAFADSGLKFGHWDITGLDDPNAYQDKESFDFVMPAKDVTLKAMTQDASIEDDKPDIVGPIVIGTTVVVGGAVLGYQAYSLGAEFAGKLMALPYFPSNRSALAMMLWEDAGKPMPESELLYPDVGQEERDMDLQHAARWAMENELIPDLNDEGTAPEEMKFYPDNAVSKIDVLKAWQKAQELKQNA